MVTNTREENYRILKLLLLQMAGYAVVLFVLFCLYCDFEALVWRNY